MSAMKPVAMAFLLAFAFLSRPLGADSGDPVLAAVLREATAVSPLDHALLRETIDNSGKTRQMKARFDPRREAGAGWTLLERNGEAPSAKYREKAAADLSGEVPQSYAMVAHMLAGPVRFLGQADGIRRYEVSPLGPGSILIDGHDISDFISGIAHIDMRGPVPLLAEMELRVTESFRPRWFAHIEDGEGRIRFGRDSGGRPVILSYRLHVSGLRPFGRIDYAVEMRFFDHVYVGSGPDSDDPAR